MMPHRVRGRVFRQPSPTHRRRDLALNCGLVEMEPTRRAPPGVTTDAPRGKHKLPTPLPRRVRIRPRQRLRQWGGAKAALDVSLVNTAHLPEVLEESLPDALRQQRHAILFALAPA